MIKVIVKNLQNETIAGAQFNTLELAEAYVASQTASQSACLWGVLAHEVCEHEGHGVAIHECQMVQVPANFTIEYVDMGDELAWEAIRAERNKLLSECDYTQLVDSPLSVEVKAQYVTYRQLLRDITEVASPDLVQWPIKPST
jgi:Phage tail assembly chaperone protein